MYQGGSLYEPYFIAINNHGKTIIGPNKKIVTTHVVDDWKYWSDLWEHEC